MDPSIARLRKKDFARLDANSHVYLDYTGAALYPLPLVEAHHQFLASSVLGNPHSSNPSSLASTDIMEETRAAILAFFGADPLKYTVVLTANASAAMKLVAESFPFRRGSTLLLATDNHNSVLGIREYATRAHATVRYVPLTDDLRLAAPSTFNALHSSPHRNAANPSLFAYPAQSNFSGVKHPLSFVATARAAGWFTLLDAAAFVPSSPLDLSGSSQNSVHPDFVALSFYKIFGFPTGVGALLARHDALAALRRPWFAGGTVSFSSVNTGMHALQPGAHGFEDGTPNFAAYAAVRDGLRYMSRIGMAGVSAHVDALTHRLLGELMQIRCLPNGVDDRATDGDEGDGDDPAGKAVVPVTVRVYGPTGTERRGGTVAFDVVHGTERVDAREVEAAANKAGISLRVGCFCNPGAAEKALGIPAAAVRPCLKRAGGGFSVDQMSKCVGIGYLGCIRISVGLANTMGDVEAFLRFLTNFCRRVAARGDAPPEIAMVTGREMSDSDADHLAGHGRTGRLTKFGRYFCGAKGIRELQFEGRTQK